MGGSQVRATQGLDLQLKAGEATQGLEMLASMYATRPHVIISVESEWGQSSQREQRALVSHAAFRPGAVRGCGKAAEAEAAKHRPTAEHKRARIAELEERAKLFGDSAKQSAQAMVLERKWERFLLVHGDEFGFDACKGPTVELVKHFTTYCFCTRDVASAIGREGLGDS